MSWETSCEEAWKEIKRLRAENGELRECLIYARDELIVYEEERTGERYNNTRFNAILAKTAKEGPMSTKKVTLPDGSQGIEWSMNEPKTAQDEPLVPKSALSRWADRALKAEAELNRLRAELVRFEWIDKFSQRVVEENKHLWEIAELAAKESFYQARDASRAILSKTAKEGE